MHDTEFTNIIYVGGGTKAMERFGKHGDNISYVTDVRANAKGYEFLAWFLYSHRYAKAKPHIIRYNQDLKKLIAFYDNEDKTKGKKRRK